MKVLETLGKKLFIRLFVLFGELFLMLPNDLARKVGNYHINPDGSIGRFPVISADERAEGEATFHDMRARNQP